MRSWTSWVDRVRARVRVRARQRRAGRAAGPDATDRPAGLQHLTDTELARAWEHTSRALDLAPDPGRRLAVAITRQLILDEAWRRDLSTPGAWDARDARACDGTDRHPDPH